jgi:hypothetical protein
MEKPYDSGSGLKTSAFLSCLLAWWVWGLGLTFANGAEPVTVGVGEFAAFGDDTNETYTNRWIVDGELRKTGTGTTTLPLANLSSRAGTIRVVDGELDVSSDGSYTLEPVPTNLLNRAAFWFDVHTNVVVDESGSNVLQWADVRESDANGPYSYFRAVSQTNLSREGYSLYPAYFSSDTNDVRPYIDFGGYWSGQWMAWKNPSNDNIRLTTIRNVFMVFGTHNNVHTFLLGDSSLADFAPGGGGNAWGPLWTPSLNAPVSCGRTFLDREQVDGLNTYPNGNYQLLDIETAMGGSAANFFNDRNLASASAGYRQGGERLCEVLVYTNLLTETERLTVEQYLWQKWLSTRQDTPMLSAADGKTAVVDIAADTVQDLEIGGDGLFIKRGDGILQTALTGSTPDFNGELGLENGEVNPTIPLPLRLTDGGVQVAVTSNRLSATSIASANRLVKQGDGELFLHTVPANVTDVTVDAGILHVLQACVAEAWPTNPVGYIPNPSFESFQSDVTGEWKTLNLESTWYGWTVVSNDIQIVNNAHSPIASGSFCPPGTVLDGTCALVLSVRGWMSTTMTLPVDGVYELSFWAATRTPYSTSGVSLQYIGHEFAIRIDGTQEVAQVQTYHAGFRKYSYRLPWLPAGDHTLLLASIPQGASKVSMVDNFHLDFVTADKPAAVIPNGSFERCEHMQAVTQITAPTNAFWTFSNIDATNTVMIAAMEGRYCKHPVDGRKVLFLQDQAEASTDILFPEAGTYELVFNIARYTDGQNIYGRSTVQSVDVYANDVKIGTLSTAQTIFTRQVIGPVTVASPNTTITLRLAGLQSYTANGNYHTVMVLDDLSVRAYSSGDNLISDDSFASQASWSSSAGSVGANIWLTNTNTVYDTDDGNAWGLAVFDDTYRFGLKNDASLWQSVAFPEAGTYRLTVHAVSRFFRSYGETDYVCYGLNPIAAWFAKEGTTNSIGTFTTDVCERFVRHTLLFSVPEAGTYDVGFTGQTTSGSKGSVVDGVSVEKVTLDTSTEPISRTTGLTLANGTKLVLNFVGTNQVSYLRYNDHYLSGIISSETYPAFVSGVGALYTPARGTLVSVH